MKKDPYTINRLLSILPAVVFSLIAHAVQAQSPSQPQPQSKPQPAAKPQPEVQAGVLYKSTMKDGKVLYSDAPMPGAVKVEKTKPDTSKRGITTATPKELEAAKKLEAGRASPGPEPDDVIQMPGATNADQRNTASLQEQLRQLEADRAKVKEPERQKQYDQAMETLRREIARRPSGR